MSSIKLKHSGGNSVSLNPPTSAPTSSDVAFKLPNADGSSKQVLQTDGAGALSFAFGGKLIKYAVYTHQGGANGDYRNSPNVITSGYQLINQSYTPAAADSTIVVFTSSVTIGETTNQNNLFWLALWNGTSFVGAVSGGASYLSYEDYLNETSLNYVGSFAAGSTTARDIQLRCGANAGTATTVYINGNNINSYTGTSNVFTAFVAELAP